ncbi:MAG: hypothetical protein HKN03_11085 [Acidimicrobiales bacterium]|nr:hypothetical protein [Acidimicrobiales bacterium]
MPLPMEPKTLMNQPAPEVTHLLELPDRMVSQIRWVALVLGTLAIALSLLGTRFGWLDYKPGGAAFDVSVRPIFTVFFGVAFVVALRWELVGGVLAAFAAAALIAFATNQLVASHAVVVVAALAAPGALWLIYAASQVSARAAGIGLAVSLVAAAAGYFTGYLVYDYYWGPTHPESVEPPLPDSALEWIWAGAVTADSAEIRATPGRDFTTARIAVSEDVGLGSARWFDARDISGRVIGFDLTELAPDTRYHYAVELDGELDTVRAGTFRTFPTGPVSYVVAIGACARVGSNGAVFDSIRQADPLLYLIAGDLHYGDNGRNDIVRYQEVMDLTLSMPAQSALYRSTAIAYMWDDHDYGGNDADGSSPSRRAAMAAYREYVPSYDLSGDETAVYQAFSAGRVRYILTDARSARNLDNDENEDAPSMLGFEQKEWFKNEILAASQTHELVVWLNPVPWIATAQDGADHWGGYAVERAELANHIANNNIDNLLMVSGDAHMVAVDDGTNTNYSDTPGPGFPLFNAAALDRLGSIKGGPYSEGTVPGGGHYGTLEIEDSGDSITATITGFTWDNRTLMEYSFSTP